MKMYGSQVHIADFLLKSKELRTENPSDADFLPPGWPKCMLVAPPSGAGLTDDELAKRLNGIIAKLPYIKKSEGEITFSSGRAEETDFVQKLAGKIPNSIFLTPEGFYTDPYRTLAPYFDPWKDVVLRDLWTVGKIRI